MWLKFILMTVYKLLGSLVDTTASWFPRPPQYQATGKAFSITGGYTPAKPKWPFW